MKNSNVSWTTSLLAISLLVAGVAHGQTYTAADTAFWDAEAAAEEAEANDTTARDIPSNEPVGPVDPGSVLDNSNNPLSLYSDGTRCQRCDSVVRKYLWNTTAEYPYRNGKPQGLARQWGAPGEGMKYTEFMVIDGKREGTMTYTTGSDYVVKVDYVADSCMGWFTMYNPDGKLISGGHWFADSPYTAPDGSTTIYATRMVLSATGGLRAEYGREGSWPYLLDGASTWYRVSGVVSGKATYRHGKLVGSKVCTDGRRGGADLECL
jgi:antitoxin component YwqK of YwqJK toxin-antitoxin module